MLHGVSLFSSPSDRPGGRLRFLMVAAAAAAVVVATVAGNMLLGGQLLRSLISYTDEQISLSMGFRDSHMSWKKWERECPTRNGVENEIHATSNIPLA